MQPLLSSVAADLRKLQGDAGDNDSVFPSIPSIYIHRKYLAAAGIPWKDEDGRQADFHALRHTFGTLLSKAGVPPRVVMELMRHSDMRRTMKTYTDPRAFDLAGAVEKLQLPIGDDSFAISATGTDVETVDSGVAKSVTQSVTCPQAAIGVCSAAIGEPDEVAENAVSSVIDGNWQQKTPSGEEGVASWGTRIRRQTESSKSQQNTHTFNSGAPKASPTLYQPMVADVNLQSVIDAWPDLPPAIRAGILAMIEAASKAGMPKSDHK